MAYKQKHQYGYRDSLDKGDPEKVIYGSDFDDEFKAIEEAIADIDPNADGGVDIGEIDGLQDALDGKADKDHTHDEYLTDAPNDGNQYVRQSQAWAEVVIPDDGIPEPDADGTPYARQVEGGQTEGAWVEAATPEDIEYLDGRIDAIEGNISGGGGFVEAPDDGADYARNGKSPAWVKAYNAAYIDDLETDYKNADAGKADKVHTHEIAEVDGLQDALNAAGSAPTWDEVTGKPADFPPSAHTHGWDEVTSKPTEFPPEAHTHDMGDVDGLEDKIDEIEGAIGELTGQLAFGGSYNASTGKVITGNLPEFVAGQPLPLASSVLNTFVIVAVSGDNPEELGEGDWLVAGQAGWVAVKYGTAGSVEWDNIVDKPSEYPPEAHGHGWDEITGKPTEFPSANAVLLTGDQSVAGHKTWTGIATFGDTVTMRGILNGDVSANFGGPVTATSLVKAGGTSSEYLMADGSVSSGPTGGGGSIADGNIVGEVTTWSGTEWTPDSSLTINSSGKVGIGVTPSGSYALSVGGNAAFGNAMRVRDGGTGKAFVFEQVGDTDSQIRSATQMSLHVNSTPRLTIDASGTATFSDDVCTSRVRSAVPDRAGFVFGNGASILPVDGTGSDTNGVASLGRDDQKYKDGWFAGTVNANKFVGDGSGLTNISGGGGLPSGDFTHNGVITATDFIATSDERAKDNITTAPVGLIDSLKGREWEWKESGEKGSGVVAQELEEVLPHLVHTDDEGMKSVAYNGLVAYLIEELKDCRQRIAELEAKS